MTFRALYATLLFLVLGAVTHAQCLVDQPACDLLSLARTFPSLADLAAKYRSNYDVQLSTVPGIGSRLNPSSPEVGNFNAFKSLFLDNISAKVNFKYSKTLEASIKDGSLTPLSLTKIQYVPEYSVTYEFKFGQWVAAKRQASAGKHLDEAKHLQYGSEASKLRKAYVEFEQLRTELALLAAEKDEQKRPKSTVVGAFYKLKSKALEILCSTDYADQLLSSWTSVTY